MAGLKRGALGRVAGVAAATLAAAAIAGCGGARSSGDALRLGVPEVPIETINWFNAASLASYNLLEAVYPTLVQFDASLRATGDLAERWRVSRDGRTWTFHLRDRTRWSDGKPLTSDDVVWTCDTVLRYADGATSFVAFLLSGVERCEAPDERTVIMRTDGPNAVLLNNISEFFVLPRHIWEPELGRDGIGLKSYAPQSDLPLVAGGPYTVKSYDRDGTTVLERNREWYGDRPQARLIGWQYFSDTDGMVAALRVGELDAVYWVPPHAVRPLEGDDIDIVEDRGVPMLYLTANAWPKNTEHPELREPDVRKAISLAIDRQRIADIGYAGFATPAATFLPAANQPAWGDSSIKPTAVDTAQANALLDGLGYERDDDGVRIANGKPMSYEIVMSTSELGVERTFETIRAGLNEIGVDVTARLVDFTTLTSETNGPPYRTELTLQNNSAFPDPDFMASLATCGQYGAYNRSGYCSPEYDRLYQQTVATLDHAKRKRLMDELQQLFVRDLPFIPLVSVDVIAAHQPSWTGLEPTLWGMAVSKLPFTAPRTVGG
jgi:peptide/nickel transport system substrate-binding protein